MMISDEAKMVVNPFGREETPEFKAVSQRREGVDSLHDGGVEEALRIYRSLPKKREWIYDTATVPYLTPDQINIVLSDIINSDDPHQIGNHMLPGAFIYTLIQKCYDTDEPSKSFSRFTLDLGDYYLKYFGGLKGNSEKERLRVTVNGNVKDIGIESSCCDLIVRGSVDKLYHPREDCAFVVFGRIRDIQNILCPFNSEGIIGCTVKTSSQRTYQNLLRQKGELKELYLHLIDENGKTIRSDLR